MTVLYFIIVGLIAGFVARAVVPGNQSMGLIATLILGLVGSFVGGFIVRAFGDNDGVGVIGSIIGAIIALVVYKMATGRSRTA